MLKHIVTIKFSPDMPDGHLEAFREKMHALIPVIPAIGTLEFGIDELADPRSWHVALVMTFANVDDLRMYQQHPAHVEVVDFNKPYLLEIVSVDYTLPE